MARGRCSSMSIPTPTFPSCNSASTRRNRRRFTSKSAEDSRPCADEGVLIVGSGNLVHNLHAYAWGRHMPDPYDWAIRFEKEAKEMMLAGRIQAADRLREPRAGGAALYSHARSLPPDAVRDWQPPEGRSHHLSNRGRRRRIDLDVDGAGRIAESTGESASKEQLPIALSKKISPKIYLAKFRRPTL